MPTFVLDAPGQAARLPLSAVTITVAARGADAVIEMTAADGLDELIRPAPHLVVAPVVTRPTTVRVLPSVGQRFPTPATVSLTLEARRHPGAEPERVQLTASDVSGLAHRDVVSIEPRGSYLEVRLIGAIEDEKLSELAVHARAGARAVLATDRLNVKDAATVTIAVDSSPSLRGLPRASVLAMVEVVIGVSRVIGVPGNLPRVGMFGPIPTWIDADNASDVRSALDEALDRAPLTVGMRWAGPLPPWSAGSARTLSYLVTDAMPADVASLQALAATAGAEAHAFVLGGHGDMVRGPGSHVRVTVVPEEFTADLGAFWLAHPERLAVVVQGLVSGFTQSDSSPKTRSNS